MADTTKRFPIWAIAAMDEQRVIGQGNTIPWHIPGEQRRFRELTMGNAVIIGRKTFESIGKPLKSRHVIVVSRDRSLELPDVALAHTIEDALEQASEVTTSAICVGGGEEIYAAILPLTDRVYMTQIHASFGGDRRFPAFEGAGFALVATERGDGDVAYSYLTYERPRA